MTDKGDRAGECPHGIDRISRYCEVCDAAMGCPDPQAQIDELRECLILAVKELDSVPPVSIYTRSVCAHDILRAIDKNLVAHTQEEHDAALAEFMTALDYYVERQQQGWVR